MANHPERFNGVAGEMANTEHLSLSMSKQIVDSIPDDHDTIANVAEKFNVTVGAINRYISPNGEEVFSTSLFLRSSNRGAPLRLLGPDQQRWLQGHFMPEVPVGYKSLSEVADEQGKTQNTVSRSYLRSSSGVFDERLMIAGKVYLSPEQQEELACENPPTGSISLKDMGTELVVGRTNLLHRMGLIKDILGEVKKYHVIGTKVSKIYLSKEQQEALREQDKIIRKKRIGHAAIAAMSHEN